MSILTNKEIGIEKYSLLKVLTEDEMVSLGSWKQSKVKSAENSTTLYNWRVHNQEDSRCGFERLFHVEILPTRRHLLLLLGSGSSF